jgi:hypothetical protein
MRMNPDSFILLAQSNLLTNIDQMNGLLGAGEIMLVLKILLFQTRWFQREGEIGSHRFWQ